MAVLRIAKMGNPVLLRKAAPVADARARLTEHEVRAAFVDHSLPDGDSLALAAEIRARTRHVAVMTGAALSEPELSVCRREDLAVLRKPFPGPVMLDLIGRSADAGSTRMAS